MRMMDCSIMLPVVLSIDAPPASRSDALYLPTGCSRRSVARHRKRRQSAVRSGRSSWRLSSGSGSLPLMTGASALLSDTCHWIGTIANSTTASPRLFLAGDVDRHHGATMFTPEGFKMIQVFEGFRAIRDTYNGDMDSSMKSEGWPPPEGSFRSKILAGDSKCRCVVLEDREGSPVQPCVCQLTISVAVLLPNIISHDVQFV